MNDNYTTVYKGLKLFRDAMLPFIVQKLQAVYGDHWWEQGVARCFKQEDIDRLRVQFEKRHDSLVVERPGNELAEMLDINWFCNIIERGWKTVFCEVFSDQKVIGWLHEVREARTAVAHPQTGDLRIDDAWRCLDNAERILRIFNAKAADEVAAIKRSLLQTGEPYAYLALIEEDAPHEQVFVLDRKEITIGRDATCDVLIPARFSRVSRKHARLTRDVEGVFIEDLGSKNGTYVNGIKLIRGRRLLAHGQQITLGEPEQVASGKVCQFEFRLALDSTE